MLDVTKEPASPRKHSPGLGRLFWAIVLGATVAAIVLSRVTSELTGHSALTWLAQFWLFEFVFGVTATLVATWGRDDDLSRASRQRQRRHASTRNYA